MQIELTSSELMALRDIVAHYLLIPTASEVFVDVIRGVETTPDQLLVRLMQLELRHDDPIQPHERRSR